MSHVSERYKQLLNQLQEAEETAADPVMELQLGKLRNSGSNMVKHGQTVKPIQKIQNPLQSRQTVGSEFGTQKTSNNCVQ